MLAGRSQREFRHMNLFPYAPHLAFWLAHHAGLGFGTFMLSTGGGKTLGTDGNIKLIDKIQPDILIGMPTFIYHVLREAHETGKRWTNLKRSSSAAKKSPTASAPACVISPRHSAALMCMSWPPTASPRRRWPSLNASASRTMPRLSPQSRSRPRRAHRPENR
jgi:hypothetical protein